MKKLYLVTDAAGHLGSTLVQMLSDRGEAMRGLILPGETPPARPGVHYVRGDVRKKASLRPFFAGPDGCKAVLIHTAGIVDIGVTPSPHLREVNVGGTQNILVLCRESPIRHLVYVRSVHAVPEGPGVQREAARFSPDWVEGAYSKTKAEATQRVLDTARAGLDAVVVHPSGIIGPNDSGRNHLVQLIRDYQDGRLPACVRGG